MSDNAAREIGLPGASLRGLVAALGRPLLPAAVQVPAACAVWHACMLAKPRARLIKVCLISCAQMDVLHTDIDHTQHITPSDVLLSNGTMVGIVMYSSRIVLSALLSHLLQLLTRSWVLWKPCCGLQTPQMLACAVEAALLVATSTALLAECW
jgi:hypothetical protein